MSNNVRRINADSKHNGNIIVVGNTDITGKLSLSGNPAQRPTFFDGTATKNLLVEGEGGGGGLNAVDDKPLSTDGETGDIVAVRNIGVYEKKPGAFALTAIGGAGGVDNNDIMAVIMNFGKPPFDATMQMAIINVLGGMSPQDAGAYIPVTDIGGGLYELVNGSDGGTIVRTTTKSDGTNWIFTWYNSANAALGTGTLSVNHWQMLQSGGGWFRLLPFETQGTADSGLFKIVFNDQLLSMTMETVGLDIGYLNSLIWTFDAPNKRYVSEIYWPPMSGNTWIWFTTSDHQNPNYVFTGFGLAYHPASFVIAEIVPAPYWDDKELALKEYVDDKITSIDGITTTYETDVIIYLKDGETLQPYLDRYVNNKIFVQPYVTVHIQGHENSNGVDIDPMGDLLITNVFTRGTDATFFFEINGPVGKITLNNIKGSVQTTLEYEHGDIKMIGCERFVLIEQPMPPGTPTIELYSQSFALLSGFAPGQLTIDNSSVVDIETLYDNNVGTSIMNKGTLKIQEYAEFPSNASINNYNGIVFDNRPGNPFDTFVRKT